jgi:hypothetical protein
MCPLFSLQREIQIKNYISEMVERLNKRSYFPHGFKCLLFVFGIQLTLYPQIQPNPDGVFVLNGVSVPYDFPYIHIHEFTPSAEGVLFCNFVSDRVYYNIILDNRGTPLYYSRETEPRYDFKAQGSRFLTMKVFSTARGGFIGLDSTYTVVDTFLVPDPYETDMHELQILPNGNYLLIAREPIRMDMSQYVADGNPNANVIGNHLIEMNSADQPVFIWKCWDHFDILDGHVNYKASNIDYVHMNSIDIDRDGNYLVSCRNMSEITKIHRKTGKIIWRLGGKHDRFEWINFDRKFSCQHDIRSLPNGNYTVFDNGNNLNPHFSRAVEFQLDTVRWTVRKIWEARENPDVTSYSMGNVQRLPNGNTLINWSDPVFPRVTELQPDGSKVFEMYFDQPVFSYRVFRLPWHGRAIKPSMIIESGTNRIVLLFNHFGASDIAEYQIYGGHTSFADQRFGSTDQPYLILIDEDVLNHRVYFFRVRTVDQNGQMSEFSDPERVQVSFVEPGENLVTNGSFDQRLEPWHLKAATSGGIARSIHEAGTLHLMIDQGGDLLGDILLYQDGLSLIQNETYLFEFDAWSDENRIIEAELEQADNPAVNYSKMGQIYLKKRTQHFSRSFRMENTDFRARIAFRCGGENVDVFLDNVNLSVQLESEVCELNNRTPETMQIGDAFPNPFNQIVSVPCFFKTEGCVELELIDIRGRTVNRLHWSELPSGPNRLILRGDHLESGVYLCRIGFTPVSGSPVYRIQKLTLLK